MRESEHFHILYFVVVYFKTLNVYFLLDGMKLYQWAEMNKKKSINISDLEIIGFKFKNSQKFIQLLRGC